MRDECYSKLPIFDYLSSFQRKTNYFYQHSQDMYWISPNESFAFCRTTVIPNLKQGLRSPQMAAEGQLPCTAALGPVREPLGQALEQPAQQLVSNAYGQEPIGSHQILCFSPPLTTLTRQRCSVFNLVYLGWSLDIRIFSKLIKCCRNTPKFQSTWTQYVPGNVLCNGTEPSVSYISVRLVKVLTTNE